MRLFLSQLRASLFFCMFCFLHFQLFGENIQENTDTYPKAFCHQKGEGEEKKFTGHYTHSLRCFENIPQMSEIPSLCQDILSNEQDIVLIEEIFEEKIALELFEQLKSRYAHFYFSASAYAKKNFRGLFVASKYELSQPDLINFSGDIDSYFKFSLQEERVKINFYVMVLHKNDCNSLKEHQINQIFKKINADLQNAEADFACILCTKSHVNKNMYNSWFSSLLTISSSLLYNYNDVSEFPLAISTANDKLSKNDLPNYYEASQSLKDSDIDIMLCAKKSAGISAKGGVQYDPNTGKFESTAEMDGKFTVKSNDNSKRMSTDLKVIKHPDGKIEGRAEASYDAEF